MKNNIIWDLKVYITMFRRTVHIRHKKQIRCLVTITMGYVWVERVQCRKYFGANSV